MRRGDQGDNLQDRGGRKYQDYPGVEGGAMTNLCGPGAGGGGDRHIREADVVVVGAGSAGCVVAARLAEAGHSVLLLEAGPDLRMNPPELMHDGWRTYREFGWGFASEPNAQGEPEPLYRGKLFGGTSWVTRFAMRGSPADFDLWERLGNDGWGFADVLPYFVRVENDLDFGGKPWHGDAGPLPITRYPHLEPSGYEASLIAAFAAAGFDPVEDHNRPGAVGAGRMPRNGRGELRVTAADAYLPVGRTPANLEIRAEAEVAEVVLDGARVSGVRLLDGRFVRAGRVVLCAGTYGSPAILLRSGIGPADELAPLGMQARVDLPGVGSNLADHPGAAIDPGLRGEPGVAPRFFTLATFHSSYANSGEAPDLAIWAYDPISVAGAPAETSIATLVLTPQSRGKVSLRSADPADPPRIELPGLRNSSDVDRLVEGLGRAWEMVNHPQVRRLCVGPPTPPADPANELRDIVTRNPESFPHVVGTCAMGVSPGQGAVVDPSGRVHGVDGLWVIDASIFPTAPSGFPHLVSIMVAERLAERLA